jgi:hypothetical protein
MELILGLGVVLAVLFVIVNTFAGDWSNPYYWAIIVVLILVFLGH